MKIEMFTTEYVYKIDVLLGELEALNEKMKRRFLDKKAELYKNSLDLIPLAVDYGVSEFNYLNDNNKNSLLPYIGFGKKEIDYGELVSTIRGKTLKCDIEKIFSNSTKDTIESNLGTYFKGEIDTIFSNIATRWYYDSVYAGQNTLDIYHNDSKFCIGVFIRESTTLRTIFGYKDTLTHMKEKTQIFSNRYSIVENYELNTFTAITDFLKQNKE